MSPAPGIGTLLGIVAAGVIDTSDCERVAASFPDQPAATWSSLAYVAVGLWIVGRCGREPMSGRWRWAPVVYGASVVLAGAGSVAYHGVGGDLGRWIHDVGFLLVLLFVVTWDWAPVGRWSPRRTVALAAGGLALAVGVAVPSPTNPALVALSGLVAVAEARAWRSRTSAERAGLHLVGATFGVAVAVYLLGRTDGPICDPDSILQGHAAWHALTALSLGLWARVAFGAAPSTQSGQSVQDVVGDAGGGIGER